MIIFIVFDYDSTYIWAYYRGVIMHAVDAYTKLICTYD
jgi:hypothetical protein